MTCPRTCSTAPQASFVKERRLNRSKNQLVKVMRNTSPIYPSASCLLLESMSHLSWKLFSGAKKDTAAVKSTKTMSFAQ